MLDALLASDQKPYIPGNQKKITVFFNLIGTGFSIDVPSQTHSSMVNFVNSESTIDYFNYSQSELTICGDLISTGDDLVDFIPLLMQTYELRGFPFALTSLAKIDLSISLEYFPTMPKAFSLFNPAHLEIATKYFMYFNNGPGAKSKSEFREIAPTHWQTKELAGSFIVQYDSAYTDKIKRVEEPPFTYSLIPINRYHVIVIKFITLQKVKTQRCLPIVRKVQEEILQSIKVKLSDSSRKEQDYAKRTWPKATIAQTMEPQKWVYDEGHWEGNQFIVTDHKATPPQWE
ncbi:hypothetical protein [Marinibactrum halimedae]|uniref:Uncharacterized protein n=1 Tax=Marinibactrum halimedae TaxID=1444977 RepID=A0AA37T0Z1_9GAMM|nr:hypothetical protein [Marinibactrum halimedae]MCD9457683.1 hypothetical protein [Marinibactrum halimedae]GLS24944.1 hypothetical protein GCM10007877_06580 [Marinibactrum halimedae]